MSTVVKNPTYSTTAQQLLNAAVPQQTRTYKPILHGQLIDLTLESILNSGFKVDSERYSSADNGQIANATYKISNVADSEMCLTIGWQNSYNKKLSLKFAIGVHVFICANGCVSGDFGAFKKKHMGSVQDFTPRAITEYIKSSSEVFEMMQKNRDEMKNIELTKRTTAELIGRMYIEEEIIQSTQLNIIQRELHKPSYDYNSSGSLWELYQHTTHSMKNIHPMKWVESHIGANNFFVNAAGILVQAPPVIEVPSDDPNLLEQLQLNFSDAVEITN